MDASWYRRINHFAIDTSWAHGFMKLYATDGVGLFALLALGAWWCARYRPDAPRAVAAAIWAAAGTVIAIGINQPIVAAVHRPRPYTTLHGVEVLVSRSHDPSFPSDHAIVAGAAAAGLWIIAHYGGKAIRGLAIAGTILALFLAFSRVYVGAHYPGDVAAGLAIGAAFSVLGWFAVKRPLTYLTRLFAQHEFLKILVVAAHPNAVPLRPEPLARAGGADRS